MSLSVSAQDFSTYSYDEVTYKKGKVVSTKTRTFKAVTIGKQTWMAENLNDSQNDACPGNTDDGCAKYGGLFTWKSAIDACPEGWRLPSDEDVEVLYSYVEKHNHGEGVGKSLKSRNGWDVSSSLDTNTYTIERERMYIVDGVTGEEKEAVELEPKYHNIVDENNKNNESERKNGTDRFGFNILPEGAIFWVGGGAAIVRSDTEGETPVGAMRKSWYASSESDDFKYSFSSSRMYDKKDKIHSVRCIRN